jgi:hypothetical protein
MLGFSFKPFSFILSLLILFLVYVASYPAYRAYQYSRPGVENLIVTCPMAYKPADKFYAALNDTAVEPYASSYFQWWNKVFGVPVYKKIFGA